MREVFMYACRPCGTVRIFNNKQPEGVAVACPACHHSTVPDPVAINSGPRGYPHRFEVPDGGETRLGK